MKKQLALFSPISVALSMVLYSGCSESVDTAKARFRPDLSRGEVRVVLLRACPLASSTNRSTFVVTYGVEVPTNGAFSDLSFNSNDQIALAVGGKSIDFRGEFSSVATGFGDLPRQSELRKPTLQNGKVMIFQDLTFTELHLDANHVDIRIRFSWRGLPQSFDFQNVPVVYRSTEQGA